MNIDLHIHTKASDGSLTPSEVVKAAVEAGLKVIAIADHDTTAGVAEALDAQRRYGIRVVPAVEVSASHPKGEAHILGYWVDCEEAVFREFLQEPRSTRPERIVAMCAKLAELGVKIRPEEVFAVAGEQASVGRAHLAHVMVSKGCVSNVAQAFERYLGHGAPAYVERFKNSTAEAISMIHRCGGISVIAHPGLVEDPELIPSLIQQGAMGLEVYCHEHDAGQVERFSRLARDFELLVTGGSDYHGDFIGQTFRLGELRVPYECFERLRETRARLWPGRAFPEDPATS